MKTLEYILNKYNLTIGESAKLEVRNTSRDTLAALLHELDFKTGVEVGVQRGLYSEVIARENPQMKVYGIDPWVPFTTCAADPERNKTESRASQGKCDQFYHETIERMRKYPNYEIIKGFSISSSEKFEDGSLDFVYIDANHDYPFVMDDIVTWSKKIRKGGILAGHDYFILSDKRALLGVKQAVDTYVTENNINPLLIWGLNAKEPGVLRDRIRSWSWVI